MTDIIDELFTLEPSDVRVALPGGTTFTVRMGHLTLEEWDSLGESVPTPQAPFLYHNAKGEEVRNYADPRYQTDFRNAESERRYRRLTLGILRGGNKIEGVMFDEQVKRVKQKMPAAAATALIRWQSNQITEGKANVMQRSEQFQPDGLTPPPDDAPMEREALGVESDEAIGSGRDDGLRSANYGGTGRDTTITNRAEGEHP